jgi:hypothetical protein
VKRALLLVGLILSAPFSARSQDVSLSGLLDLRLVAPSSQDSFTAGGFGKFRWGDGRGSLVVPDLGGAVLRGSAALTPDLRVVAEIRYDAMQKTAVDILDAYARYRPVSTSRWRWSVRGGAFFLPGSLENTGIGWTTEWTLTPSAINSWIGTEIRILGGEATLEWRGDVDHFEFVTAAFGENESAGEVIASYGWTFSDRVAGLLDHFRMAHLTPAAQTADYDSEFRQFDHSVGWYAGMTWERPDIGRLSLLRYDNNADPNGHDHTDFAWRTKFWSLAGSTQLGPVVILSQAMVGRTTIEPSLGHTAATEFWAYYVLAGIERGDWRFAVRFDQFATSKTNTFLGPNGNEHGLAGTAAVTWMPRKGIRLVGEIMTIDYIRSQRALFAKAPHVTEVQAQLALRLSF